MEMFCIGFLAGVVVTLVAVLCAVIKRDDVNEYYDIDRIGKR